MMISMEFKISYYVHLYELLTYGRQEYQNLLAKMLGDEFYILQDKVYDILVECRLGDDLVGILVGEFESEEIVIIDLGYIVQEHRDKGFFCKVLGYLTEMYGNIWLSMPNGFAIRSLLNNGLARMLNDYIVQSDYTMTFKTDDGRVATSRFYDLRISAVVDMFGNELSPVMDVDDYCFKARSRRDEIVNSEYFKEFIRCVYNEFRIG